MVDWIGQATTSIHLHVYQFSSPELFVAIQSAVNRGVECTILLEGGILGDASDDANQRGWADELANANKSGKGGGGGDCPPCEEGAPEWMATFADMVTLLMVFFVLMYAIASKNISTVKSVLAGEESASVGVLELMDAVEIKESISCLLYTSPSPRD